MASKLKQVIVGTVVGIALATMISKLLSHDDNPGPGFTVDMRTDKVSREQVDQALAAFRAACVPLGGKYWGDVIEAKAVVQDTFAEYRQRKGWGAEIELSVKLPDDPKIMPAATDAYGVAAGHTLWYYLGGGDDPGVFAKKRVSQGLCGLRPNEDGADGFLRVPDLKVLGGKAVSPDLARWCAYKREKDALSIEANKNRAFTSEGGGNWLDARAAWIEPKIADLQVQHFGTLDQANKMATEWASKANCR